MGNDGIVISEGEPTTSIGKFTWLQILQDGTRKWFERADGGWSLVKTEDAPVSADHSHSTLGDIDFTGTISADGYSGHSERVTIGDKKLTFKEGLCILIEDV